MSNNDRFYIIRKNKILLSKEDHNFPDISIIRSNFVSVKIEMGVFHKVKCIAIIPVENWQNPVDYEFYPIKALIRKTERSDLKLAGLAGFLCNWFLSTKFCGRCGTENEMHPNKGDVIIIGSSPDLHKAEIGAKAAAL